MGCDIHIVLEKKNDADRWVGLFEMGYLPDMALELCWYGTFKNEENHRPSYIKFAIKERDYSFFYAIAQVRGYDNNKDGLPPRGLPDDLSDLAQMIVPEDGDLHSHSWLLMSELRPILITKKEGDAISGQVAAALQNEHYLDPLHRWVHDDIDLEHPDEYRIVFAFDN